MRNVYVVSGGVSKFAKARPDKTFQAIVKEAYDYAIADLGLTFPQFTEMVDGSVASYFSDHFQRQLMSGIMVQDYLGLLPKPSHRVEGGGATGGLCFQEAWKNIASGHMDICAAFGFETMSHVNTWKGNEFIALASDVSFDYPVGGFYSGYYAMMVTRHMKEFGDRRQRRVSVKNHINAYPQPLCPKRNRYSIQDVQEAPMVTGADPPGHLRDERRAAAVVLCSEELAKLERLRDHLHRRQGIGSTAPCACQTAATSRMISWQMPAHQRDSADTPATGIVGARLRCRAMHSFRAGGGACRLTSMLVSRPKKSLR
jgi:acetyl-CoA C-acetyltransferase